ncbi:hypothetical protein EDM55_15810 [Brevibacillus centrosporus]|nr:hypothetical protein EDM55_15810 [Brevibacillus centrosporus]
MPPFSCEVPLMVTDACAEAKGEATSTASKLHEIFCWKENRFILYHLDTFKVDYWKIVVPSTVTLSNVMVFAALIVRFPRMRLFCRVKLSAVMVTLRLIV